MSDAGERDASHGAREPNDAGEPEDVEEPENVGELAAASSGHDGEAVPPNGSDAPTPTAADDEAHADDEGRPDEGAGGSEEGGTAPEPFAAPSPEAQRWADRLAVIAVALALTAAFGGAILEIVLSATE